MASEREACQKGADNVTDSASPASDSLSVRSLLNVRRCKSPLMCSILIASLFLVSASPEIYPATSNPLTGAIWLKYSEVEAGIVIDEPLNVNFAEKQSPVGIWVRHWVSSILLNNAYLTCRLWPSVSSWDWSTALTFDTADEHDINKSDNPRILLT